MHIKYVVVERFNDKDKAWYNYMAMRSAPQLKDIVSLDSSLCPPLNMQERNSEKISLDFGAYIVFNSLNDLALNDIPKNQYQVLAVIFNPILECESLLEDSRFRFCGYDLLDASSHISALVNCGKGFARAYSNEELNFNGLISNYSRTREIQRNLLMYYPDEEHADCSIIAIWRIEN